MVCEGWHPREETCRPECDKVAQKNANVSSSIIFWRFVRHQFAGMARFVPLAMDWDGAFGPTFIQVLKGWANTEIDRCTGVARLRLDDKCKSLTLSAYLTARPILQSVSKP